MFIHPRELGHLHRVEVLDLANNSLIIPKATDDLWNANKEGLGPPFYQLKPENMSEKKDIQTVIMQLHVLSFAKI